MKNLVSFQKFLLAQLALLMSLLAPSQEGEKERGDVPGWVMITMMTAILVAGLLVVAKDALIGMFNSAMAMIGQ